MTLYLEIKVKWVRIIKTFNFHRGIAEVAENVSESDFGVDEGPVLPVGSEPILGLGQPVDMTATANYAFVAKKSSQISFNKGAVFSVSEIQVCVFYWSLIFTFGWCVCIICYYVTSHNYRINGVMVQ